jgi:hypothetical protein
MKRKLLIKNISKDNIDIEIRITDKDNITDIFKTIVNENIEDIYGEMKNSFEYFSINDCMAINSSLRSDEITSIDVILKAPFVKSKMNLFSCIEILSNGVVVQNIPIQGYLEIPKLLCLKEMNCTQANLPLISVQIEVKSKGQKFKIPFKNMSMVDLDLDIILEKKFNDNLFTYREEVYQCQFICFPGNLTVSAQSTSTLDLIAKVTKASDDTDDKRNLGNKIRKVLIAKVRNANVFYTFFVEAIFK